MNTTSNNSGADDAERYFNETYRDENGKIRWDKVRKDVHEAAQNSENEEPKPLPEWLIRLRASNPDQKKNDDNPDEKKDDGNNDQAA